MPRRRPKTAADRPIYRIPKPLPVPDELQGYSDGFQLRRIVEQYGVENVQLVLGALAEANRRDLIERRCQEMRDAWKDNARPLGPIRIPHLSALRSARDSRGSPGYRGHREEDLDKLIRRQERARELESGLAVILDHGANPGRQQQLAEIVRRAVGGETAAEIATALGVSVRTVEARLAELREAAVTKEEQELASTG